MRKLLIALAAIGVIGMVTPMTGPADAGWKQHGWKYHHRHSGKRHSDRDLGWYHGHHRGWVSSEVAARSREDLRWQAPPRTRFSWADIQAVRAFTRMH
jgi:Ni/Co efflux regulator RcnB